MHIDKLFFPIYDKYHEGVFSGAEVAKLLGVDRATVTRWIQKGKIKGAVRINGEKNWKIPIAAYQELAKTKP